MACDLTISIASYNTRDILKKCLDSIFHHTRDITFEVIVVDNGSADGSGTLVREHFPSVRVLENEINAGFGKAHNQAFSLSKGRYFLALNSDTVVLQNTLTKMVGFMDGEEKAGIAGCRMYWDDARTFIFPDVPVPGIRNYPILFMDFCRRFPNSGISRRFWKKAYRFWQTEKALEVEAVQGGFIFIRRDVIADAGLFDDRFFLFFEEFDFYRRVRARGWKIYYVPEAEVVHYYGLTHKDAPGITEHQSRSERYYYQKHYGPAGRFFLRGLKFAMARLRGQTAVDDAGGPGPAWKESSGAVKYILEISQDANFVRRVGVFVTGHAYIFPPALLARLENSAVFWRVVPVFADGTTGSPLQAGRFVSPGGE